MAGDKKKRCGWIVIIVELALLVIVALVLWWIFSNRNDEEEEEESRRSEKTGELSDEGDLSDALSHIYDRLNGTKDTADSALAAASSAAAQSSSAVESSVAVPSSAVQSSGATQSSSAAQSSAAMQASSEAQASSSGFGAQSAKDACERFLRDEETALVLPVDDCYNTNDWSAGAEELYFSEMIALYQDAANSVFSGEKETPLDAVEYTYIDVNLDGEEELLLRFKGMNIYAPDDDSSYEVVLSYEDGGLCQLHREATWARSYSDISYEGLIFSGGSAGAEVFVSDLSVLLDGECHELYSETGYGELESFCSALGRDVVSERLVRLAAENLAYGEEILYYEILVDDAYYYYASGDPESSVYLDCVRELFDEFGLGWVEPEEMPEIMKDNFFWLAGEHESARTLWEYISGEREARYPVWRTYSLLGVPQE